jgi:hypothetical protein
MTDPRGSEGQKVDYEGAGKALLEKCIARCRTDQARVYRDRQDWKNLLYYRGGADNQWVVWDGNRYVTKPVVGDGAIPDWVPRCATNVFARQIDGISALLDQSSPAQEWRPATDDDDDLATADVIEDVMPVLREESGYEDIRPLINKHVTLCDKVACIVYFDTDPKHGEELIQAYRCVDPECGQVAGPADLEDSDGACPTCGGGVEPAVDAMFRPMGMLEPRGRLTAELVPSFELSLPPGSRTTETSRLPFVLLHSRFAIEDARRLWGGKASTLRASKVGTTDASRSYADGLAFLSSPQSSSESSGMGMSAGESCLVYRLYHDPIDSEDASFPEGLYIAMSDDGTVLEAGPLPLKDAEGRPIKNLAIRTFMPIPGTAFGKPPGDDLSQLQTQLNLSETLAFMILMHDSAPQTWIPDTVTVLGEIENVPGAINRYRSHTPGERPVTVEGRGFPESLKWWLDRIDTKMQEQSGLNAVLLGQRPAGDPTLGEVELLREQGLGAFKTPLDELIRFEVAVSKLLLYTARQSMWAPRFRKVRGENGQWEISQFTAADLAGAVDVTVEPTSAWPKSLLVQQMRVEKAVEMGLLMPQGDPELQVKLLSQMNLLELKPSLDVDRKQIARELDRWKAAKSPMEIAPPDIPAINVQMHAFYKANFLRTELADEMKRANPPVYQAMMQHLMMLQMAMQPPAPPGPPAPQSGEAGGDGAALEEAVSSGALKPAGPPGAETGASPLDALVQGGTLMPASQNPADQAQAPGPSMDDLMESGVLTPALAPGQPPQEVRGR